MTEEKKADTVSSQEGQLVQKSPEQSEADKEIKEIEEFVKGAPPEIRAMMMEMRTSTTRSPQHPLFEKFTPAHIDKFLDYNEDDHKRDFTFATQSRWFHFGYVIIALSFIVFLIVYLLPNNKDILNDLLKVLVGLAGGFGLGYGYKSMK